MVMRAFVSPIEVEAEDQEGLPRGLERGGRDEGRERLCLVVVGRGKRAMGRER